MGSYYLGVKHKPSKPKLSTSLVQEVHVAPTILQRLSITRKRNLYTAGSTHIWNAATTCESDPTLK